MRYAVAVMLIALSLPQPLAAEPATTLAASKLLVTDLKVTLEGLLVGADFAAQKKIEALLAQTTALLRHIDRMENDAVTDVNQIADNVGRPTAELLRSTHELVAGAERQTFLDVATISASLSNAISGLPLSKVRPFVAAIQPNRFDASPVDRTVKIYGYFGESDATLPVKIVINGETLDASPTPGGVRFKLPMPASGYQEESFIPIKVRIPRRTGMLFWKSIAYDEISDQLYISRKAPFACVYTKYLPNPAFMPQVVAAHEYVESAATQGGGNRPSNNGSLSAETLLINTVDNAPALYKTSEAKIIAPNCRVWSNGVCEHNNPSATWNWTSDVINYALSAPSKEPHWHNTQDCHDTLLGRVCIPGGYLHGGGGSHANIACAPTFIVPRLGVAPQIMGERASMTLMRRDSKRVAMNLPQDNWSVTVSCQFKDGDRSFQPPLLTIGPLNRSVTISPVHAEVTSSGELVVETQYQQTRLASR